METSGNLILKNHSLLLVSEQYSSNGITYNTVFYA